MPLLSSDLAACRALMRGGSRSFSAASKLLPRRVTDPALALYAFCRVADDLIDDGNRSGSSVAKLRSRLALAYEGRPLPIPADRAFAAMVAHHAIPAALPEALLEGFAWDEAGRRYEDFPALLDYAARVAGSVGAMMALLMGVRDPELVARACDLGMAMQLSNIARDVGEDARAGRVYLPLQWLREAGIDPDALIAHPEFTPALGEVVARLLRAADDLYVRAEAGIAGLPLDCRPGIGAARLLYDEIGREVLRQGCDSVSRRAVVSRSRKLRLLAFATLASVRGVAPPRIPTLDAARFLVAAVAASPPVRPEPRRSFDDRVAWLVDLFARLDQREQMEA